MLPEANICISISCPHRDLSFNDFSCSPSFDEPDFQQGVELTNICHYRFSLSEYGDFSLESPPVNTLTTYTRYYGVKKAAKQTHQFIGNEHF